MIHDIYPTKIKFNIRLSFIGRLIEPFPLWHLFWSLVRNKPRQHLFLLLYSNRLIEIVQKEMNVKKKIQMSSQVNDNQGFQYERHGIKMPSTGKKLRARLQTTPENVIGNSTLNQALTGKVLPRKQQSVKQNNVTSLENFTFKAIDSVKEIQSCISAHPFNDESRLDEETLQKALALSHQGKRIARSEMRRKKNDVVNLKDLVSKQKVSNLRNKFIDKIRRNNAYSQAVDFIGFEEEKRESLWKLEGFKNNSTVDNLIGLINIISVFMLVFMSSLDLVFDQLRQNSLLWGFQIFSLLFFFFEMIYNSVTIKSKAGKKLSTFEEIFDDYLHSNLIIDAINILVLFIDLNTEVQFMIFLRMFIVTKIPQGLQKLEKLEVSFIKNYYNEQYWSLVKVVLFNFCFAHVLAIFLTAMVKMESSENWHVKRNIVNAGWSSQYIWAYYWAVNIMLTVGFGDLSATNADEALCLIFIEIFSVMCLAYNINWIGTLISNIRAQDLQKGRNIKTFKQLSDKYSLPSELEWRISSYIEESVNIRKKFNLQEEKEFIQSLPGTMQKDYLKESNKSIFQQLPFFSGLIDKTLASFAQKIEMTISHPEQILRRKEDEYNLLILRQGEIGYTVKKNSCNFNNLVIDRVRVNKNDRPFILGLQFLTRERPSFQIKSLEYSVVYSLSYQNLIETLRESQMDYLLYCSLRDKNKSSLDQFQVLKCSICKNQKKHTKFTCPKLHFIPLEQMVIHKENNKVKHLQNERNQLEQRVKKLKINALSFRQELLQNLENLPYGDKSQAAQKKKLKNPFIDQIKKLKKLKETIEDEENMGKNEQSLLKSASELIKKQFERYLKPDQYEDELWTLACDKAKNYKEYFPEGNSCSLEISFSSSQRKDTLNKQSERTKLRIGSWSIHEEMESSVEEQNSSQKRVSLK